MKNFLNIAFYMSVGVCFSAMIRRRLAEAGADFTNYFREAGDVVLGAMRGRRENCAACA